MQFSELKKMIKGNLLESEPMKNHTSYGVGGPALAYVEPTSIEDLQTIRKYAKKNQILVYCIGDGSNLLVSDEGIDGIVVSLKLDFRNLDFNGNKCDVGCGIKLSQLVKASIKRNLGGLETLIGIPGTLGGALIMNAGAFGQEISNYLVAVKLMQLDGSVIDVPAKNIDFAYRSSSFGKDDILLSAEFQLVESSASKIQKNYDQANNLRKSTQPLKARSAGSVFKNPKEIAAGYLIDQAGLKGNQIGGATISNIHANFIINNSDAKADDIVQLIKLIKRTIKKKYSINLELEISTLGFADGTFDA